MIEPPPFIVDTQSCQPHLPEPNDIRTDFFAPGGYPDGLLPDRRSRVGSVEHLALRFEDTHMPDTVGAIPTSSPEKHIAGPRLLPWQMLTHQRGVLVLRRAWNGLPQHLTNSELGETRAIEAAVGRAVAPASAPDVWQAQLR